jgi:hypothetical protein
MKFKIIEDCSPYYIRYTHDNFEDIIQLCTDYKKQYVDALTTKSKFMHLKLPVDLGSFILDKVYKAIELQLFKQRVSLFVTQSNHYYRPHRDGLAIKMGINYHIDIKDDLCVTSWYDNKLFEGRPIDTLGGVSREIGDYNREVEKEIIKPSKSMTAKQNEVVLFNTDYFHDVDNTASPNERTILTLRSSLYEKIDFFDARQILFGY